MLSMKNLRPSLDAPGRASDRPSRPRVAPRLLAVAIVLAGLAACTDEGPSNIVDDTFPGESLLYNMQSYLHTDGTRTGTIIADSAYTFPDSSRIDLFGMEMTLYHDDASPGSRAGRDRARIQARLGKLNTRTEELTAIGDVVARVVDQGLEITTSILQYDPTSERIWSDSATVIRTDDGSVTRGTSFNSDLTFSNWRLENPVGDIPAERGDGGPPRDPGAGA